MTRTGKVGRRLLLSIDAKGYGSANGRRQHEMQSAIIKVLNESSSAAQVSRDEWECQSGGDGELAILPAGTPENVVVDDFVRKLAESIDGHNEDLKPEARLRLRMAIHHGVVLPAANGYAGMGIVVVSRLADSPQIRAAQAAVPEAGLVVMLSNRVYLDTVAQELTLLRAERLRRVTVRVKEYTDDAFLYIPGHDVRAIELGTVNSKEKHPARPSAESGGSSKKVRSKKQATTSTVSASVLNTFNAPVEAHVIGIAGDNVDR